MVEINFPFVVFRFCKRSFFFLKVLFLWSIKLFWINYAKLVMYLNACSMDLGHDTKCVFHCTKHDIEWLKF